MIQNRVQTDLFPSVIKTIGYNQIDILQDIMTLYCPQGFECDPTYSIGNFYKSAIPQPKYKFDINPQVSGVIQASAENLPLGDGSVSSVLFDPPFLIGAKANPGKIRSRFNQIPGNIFDLWAFYKKVIIELYRVLLPAGILVFKCQDVADGKNFFSHVQVFNDATYQGFQALDLFVLLAKHRMPIHNQKRQRHARKYHSYFWVFQKRSMN